jgi:putative DNA methylase
VFWMRLYGRTNVSKGEARFLAQADNLRLEDMRDGLLAESSAGFRLLVDSPVCIGQNSATFDVARGLAGAYATGGTEAAAELLACSERAVDDEQLWAVIGELVAQLPASDATAKALAAVQRNASAIKNLAKGISAGRDDSSGRQQTLFDLEELAR